MTGYTGSEWLEHLGRPKSTETTIQGGTMKSYTPTTEDVEFCYQGEGLDAGERSAGFYRWLAGVKAQALQEAADRLEASDKPWESPLYESTILWLRASAQRLKEEA